MQAGDSARAETGMRVVVMVKATLAPEARIMRASARPCWNAPRPARRTETTKPPVGGFLNSGWWNQRLATGSRNSRRSQLSIMRFS